MMMNEQISIINSYFNSKHMDRKQLEAVLDFDNLTMDGKYIHEIMELLKAGKDEAEEDIIRKYVLFVKGRSGSGEITWDEFVARLKDLSLEYSRFGIRVQRFSNYSYWEVFFNHFDITKYEDGNEKMTFNQKWYEDTETAIAYEYLADQDIDTDESKIMPQIAAKWGRLAVEEKDNMVSALNALYATQYVDRSRMSINKDMIERISMSGADLVPEVGLRDYYIEFVGGDSISLRF